MKTFEKKEKSSEKKEENFYKLIESTNFKQNIEDFSSKMNGIEILINKGIVAENSMKNDIHKSK